MSGEESTASLDVVSAGTDGVAFDYEGVTYHVEPKALSSKVMRALVRLYDKEYRDKLQDMIQQLRGAKTDAERELVKEVFGFVSQRMEKVQVMLQTEEGVATVLHLCSPQINSYEQAIKLVEEHPNFLELIQIVGSACGYEAVGN